MSLKQPTLLALVIQSSPKNHDITHHNQSPSPAQAMAPHQHQHDAARHSDVSTADSAVDLPSYSDAMEMSSGRGSDKHPLYANLRSLIDQKRRHWVITRDVELARPLQQRYLAHEAEVMADIHEIEQEREVRHQRREQEMQGARGTARLSWKLYKIKTTLCGGLRRRWLHGGWKHDRLSAKRGELSEEYVRVQTGRRMDVIREVIWAASEEAVDGADDGAYVRDNMLNWITTGYDSMFPLSRDLDVNINRP